MNHEEFYNSLSDELKAKLKACKSKDEMMDTLKAANIELDSEMLDQIAGGQFMCPPVGKCPPHLRGDSVSCPPVGKCPPHLRDGSNSCPPYLRQG